MSRAVGVPALCSRSRKHGPTANRDVAQNDSFALASLTIALVLPSKEEPVEEAGVETALACWRPVSGNSA